MTERFVCIDHCADGEQFFVVDSEETFKKIVAIEQVAFDEAEVWGGFKFDVSIADLVKLYDIEDPSQEDIEYLREFFRKVRVVTSNDIPKDWEQNPAWAYQSIVDEFYTFEPVSIPSEE